MTTPSIKTLADKAMLVRLQRGMFTADVTDRDATELVEQSSGVKKVGRFRKKLLVESVKYKDVLDAYTALYAYHQKHTIPWTDAGPRLLPATMYFDYTQEMRALRAACDNALMRLSHVWQAEVAHDMARLGAMANADDYPADITKRFYHELSFLPVPSSGDFRVQIDPEDQASLENAIAAAERGVSQHIIESLLEPLQHAAAKLAIPIGEKGSVFRDTLIENLAEVVERLPRLDISGDPQIQQAIAETRKLVDKYRGMEDALRAVPEVRAQAAAEAQDKVQGIMDTFGGLF